jgi:hypothetical protein
VSEAWSFGAHAKDEPGGDMFAFWRARYNEQWPPTAPAAVRQQLDRRPKWARR